MLKRFSSRGAHDLSWLDENAAALTTILLALVALALFARLALQLGERRGASASIPPATTSVPSVWLEAAQEGLAVRFENRGQAVIRDVRVTSVTGPEPTIEILSERGIPYLPPGAQVRRLVAFEGERAGLVTLALRYECGGRVHEEVAAFDLDHLPTEEIPGGRDLLALRSEALQLRDVLTQTIDEINDGLIAGAGNAWKRDAVSAADYGDEPGLKGNGYAAYRELPALVSPEDAA